MKKIVLVLVAAMVLVFTGCEKKETISMPFDVADVNNIEMYRNAEPYSAEKQVITESEDIADLYSLFSGLEVSDKKTEPVVGETITSFRFNLSDDTSYEIIYCAEAVKSGRLKFPAEKLDYFTSADIGGRWDSYQYEIVPVSESELPGQSENPSDPPLEETHEWDKIPMVMVDGKLYYDTGKESTISGRCGVMDGEITSTVDGSEIPTKDNQSNFGTGFEYQYGADNTIEIFMNEKWIVFEQREGVGAGAQLLGSAPGWGQCGDGFSGSAPAREVPPPCRKGQGAVACAGGAAARAGAGTRSYLGRHGALIR